MLSRMSIHAQYMREHQEDCARRTLLILQLPLNPLGPYLLFAKIHFAN
jgi:hypothetical protein